MTNSLNVHHRSAAIDQLEKNTFDLCVIGGGITGAGIARDAQSRGLSVALIEARDFAEGTSSRSSKLIHGGIRYLENLEFGLVFEALSERRLLFEIAPHLVHPLRFVLPLYRGGRVGMGMMGLGMWLYDALSLFEAPEMHERLDAEEACRRLPLLQARDLLGAYAYSDAYMDDDRLVHETLRPAVAQGAVALNYIAATGARMVDGRLRAVVARDRKTSREINIRARHFISTVGPWTDAVATELLGSWHPILRPSKGVHLTFDRRRLQLNEAVVMAADQQKRIVFGIPRHEMCIIGTTDTDFSGDPADVTCSSSDVEYLLGVANEYFPGAKLERADILATYAGVRPLVDDGSATESKTSREHLILNDPRNVTFVAGGKYTTYRRMAEQAVESALACFPIEDQVRWARSDTQSPLNPVITVDSLGESLRRVREQAQSYHVSEATARWLTERHGPESDQLLRHLDQVRRAIANGAEESHHAHGVEAIHAIRETGCQHLRDFYTRRVPLVLSRRDHGLGMSDSLSRVFAAELSWSEERRADEVRELRAQIDHDQSALRN
jgi:glycerol-3-phosphate dehydrogenase